MRTILLAFVLLAGCAAPDEAGPEDDAGTTPATTPSPGDDGQAENVRIEGFAFHPDTLRVAVGTTVTWSNRDDVAHTATADETAFDTGSIGSGEEASHTFDSAGTYTYHCEFHPSMTAILVVE